MDDSNAAPTVVYHFLDDHLLQEFFETIPRSCLMSYLRNSDSLRNRHFPGFRISAKSGPPLNRIVVAFKSEVVLRHNNDLATALCADWIKKETALASTALNHLGVQSSQPSDARSWINEVHDRIGGILNEQLFRALVRVLATNFSDSQVHIFISIISYGLNQQALQQVVKEELTNARTNPWVLKEVTKLNLSSAQVKINDLQGCMAELHAQQTSYSLAAEESLGPMLLGRDHLTETGSRYRWRTGRADQQAGRCQGAN